MVVARPIRKKKRVMSRSHMNYCRLHAAKYPLFLTALSYYVVKVEPHPSYTIVGHLNVPAQQVD